MKIGKGEGDKLSPLLKTRGEVPTSFRNCLLARLKFNHLTGWAALGNV